MPIITRGQNLNRQEVADFFGVAGSTVDAWIKRGLPVNQRGGKGKPWIFNSSDVAKWLEQRAKESSTGDLGDERQLKARKLAAEAAKIELELARARGDLVPLSQLERALANTFAELKTNMRTVPSRVANALIGEDNETRIKMIIMAEIDQALEALGDFDLDDEADDE